MTAVVLRRTAIVLGLIGAVMLATLSVPVSVLTFGSDGRAGAIALLGLAVFFRLVSEGQGALIQGMRRIADLAKARVLGTLFGGIIGIGFVYLWGEDGVDLPSSASPRPASVFLVAAGIMGMMRRTPSAASSSCTWKAWPPPDTTALSGRSA